MPPASPLSNDPARTRPLPEVIRDFRATVESAARELGRLGDADVARRPAPGKWSPKEVIGHLIDSACNNHRRFVLGQIENDLVFPGYAQDAWVSIQRYQDEPWTQLLGLWRAYNLHIAHVMESAPEAQRARPRSRHNLAEIATVAVAESEVATLEYMMRDYVVHLKHHLGQILPIRSQ